MGRVIETKFNETDADISYVDPSSADLPPYSADAAQLSMPDPEARKNNKYNPQKRESRDVRWIKWGIWLYFFLLIFEGSLRKWVLPGLSTPLLVVRDPVALLVLLLALKRNLIPWNLYVVSMVVLGALATITAVTLGHGVLFVAAFGARPLLIHVPFAFLIGRVFNRQDVIRVGVLTLWITIPMTALVFLQFYSPQSAWVNRGVGGDMEGAGFSGAMGYMRPPGTFSFITGMASFYGLASAYAFYFWLNLGKVNRWLLWSATAAILLAIPLSISRTLMFQVGLSIVFFVAVAIGHKKYLPKIMIASIAIGVLVFLASLTPVFQTATTVMASRFNTASKHEGGLQGTLVDRFLLGGLAYAIVNAEQTSLFGAGIGLGTNVGAKYTTGKFNFLIAEGEWGRIVGEMGPILGLLLIFLRAGMAFQYLTLAIRKLFKGDSLPWMLMSFGFITILQGGWAQPANLGFYTMITGLVLASYRKPKQRKKYRDSDERVSHDSTDLVISGVTEK